MALTVDADNVFIVLSARALKQKLQIISRVSESSYPRLRKAGADNVIMIAKETIQKVAKLAKQIITS